MHPLPEPRPRHRRYSVRRQARLDAETHAKLEELAHTFHRKRAQILRYVMQWALAHTQGWTVDPSIPDRPHLLGGPGQMDVLVDVADQRGRDEVVLVVGRASEAELQELAAALPAGRFCRHQAESFHQLAGSLAAGPVAAFGHEPPDSAMPPWIPASEPVSIWR
jgi:hypothetical protein